MKDTKIIAGFPCIGKSYLTRLYKTKCPSLNILDSDSMSFSWLWDNRGCKIGRNPNFPENYINYIKSHLGKADIILVSTHPIVIDELIKNNIVFTYVRPEYKLLDEYIERMKTRGNDNEFISNIVKVWFDDTGHNESSNWDLVELKSGEYIDIPMIESFKSFHQMI